MSARFSRRKLLGGLAAGAGAGLLLRSDTIVSIDPRSLSRGEPVYDEEEPYGPVMSGPARFDGASEWMIMTRAYPPPGEAVAEVEWEVARDIDFDDVVAGGRVTATAEADYHVKLSPNSLTPRHRHYFRFRTRRESGAVWARSDIGRFTTFPTAGDPTGRITLIGGACQNWNWGYYHAWADVAELAQAAEEATPDHDPELIVVAFYGDYIYESDYVKAQFAGSGNYPRVDQLFEARSLAAYRAKYKATRSDPDLRAAHQHLGWIVMRDDHETLNDYTVDGIDLQRLGVATQAWEESMPVPQGRHHRSYRIGDLAQLIALDTRSYRSRAAGEMLGHEQRSWMRDEILASRRDGVAWRMVMSSTPTTPGVKDIEGFELFAPDGWGRFYRRDRNVLYRALTGSRSIITSGDVHRADFTYMQELGIPEMTVGAISSLGRARGFFESRHLLGEGTKANGYLRLEASRDGVVATYRGFDARRRSRDHGTDLRRCTVTGDGRPRLEALAQTLTPRAAQVRMDRGLGG